MDEKWRTKELSRKEVIEKYPQIPQIIVLKTDVSRRGILYTDKAFDKVDVNKHHIEPEEFSEYRIPQEPILIDESVETIKDYLKENNLSIVNFLKSFPRKKRLDMVDMLRGALPIPIDYKELHLIGKTLNMPSEEVYHIWETRMRQVLESAGMNTYSNSELVNSMFDCAKKYLMRG